ncbi:MAG TPA: ParM/StbA family protein [Methanothermobacter sp.]|nr:ParM/StbA family protein [Methanothermobacter sp.]
MFIRKGEPGPTIRAVDVGFGRVKALSEDRQLEFPSVVSSFRPVRYSTGINQADPVERLCCEYAGRKYFIGDIVFKQADAMVTMNAERFTRPEGLALMFSALALLSGADSETLNLATGLPVSDFAGKKDVYRQALLGRHYIKLVNPDGSGERVFNLHVADCRILPQPMGTVFDRVLNDAGELVNKRLAAGNVGVLDIGQNTVDLVRVDGLEFVDGQSDSFSDLGLFDAYGLLYREIKDIYNVEIPPARMEKYLQNNFIEVDGYRQNIAGIKQRVFAAHAERIVSRALNLWRDAWQLNSIIVTGGGAAILGDYISRQLNRPGQVELVDRDRATLSNANGYLKLARRVWQR